MTEWQYGTVRPLLLLRADLLVWLDLPRAVVMGRVVRRTAQRRLARTALWNDNLEPPLSTFFTDRDHIVRWAWRTHHEHAGKVAAAMASRADLTVVRLTRQREVDRWLEGPLRDICRPGSHTGYLGPHALTAAWRSSRSRRHPESVANISGHIRIAAPPEQVFDMVADSRKEPSFNADMTDVELLTSAPIGRGTTFPAHMGKAHGDAG